ncbi:MAG: DUF4446 family protein [Bacillota bacterium]|nr:DUF4446 family protein [Bacillota bacterium]
MALDFLPFPLTEAEAVSLVLGLLGFGLAILSLALLLRTRRWLHRWRKLLPLRSPEELLQLLERQQADLAAQRQALAQLAASLESHEARFGNLLQPPRVLHYAAFGEGHPWSFTILFADELGNGFLLTSIQGREEGRLYAKILQEGRSPQPLSPEEILLLQQAGILPSAQKLSRAHP